LTSAATERSWPRRRCALACLSSDVPRSRHDYLCVAKEGYDAPTGLGSLDGIGAF